MTRRLLGLGLAAALLAATTACGVATTPLAPTAPGTGADKVATGVIAIVDVAPIYLGKQKGFFSQHGIDLDLRTEQGGAAIIPAVVAGQYQFGFSNVISLLLAQSRGLPIKAVTNGTNTTGDPTRDFGAIVVKNQNIRSAKDLTGKKVATNTLKNIVDTTVKNIVQRDDGDPSKVNFVELAFPDMAAALDAGQVDAMFVVEPFLTEAKDRGWRTIGSYADIDPRLCVALYFTSTQLATSDPDLVKRFGEAMNQSLAYADAHPAEVRAVLNSYTQITPETAAKLTLPRWPTAIDTPSITKLGNLAQSYGLLPTKPDVTKLLP